MSLISVNARRYIRAPILMLALVLVSCAPTGESEPDADVSDQSPSGIRSDSRVDASPLSAPGPASGPLLAAKSAEETGLSFQNTLPLENTGQYLYVGAGSAAGDYDLDGLADVFMVSQTGQSRLFKNLGGWQFEDVTDQAGLVIDRTVDTGRWDERFPMGAGFADLDEDGDLDLYVTAFAGSSVVFENNGDGTFTDVTAESGAAHVGAATTPAFADYDRDGDVDVYLATYRPYGTTRIYPPGSSQAPEPDLDYDKIDLLDGYNLMPETDVLLSNNGDGTFTDVTEEAGIEGRDWGLAAVFGDFNQDGWSDLYVANDFETPDRLYMNQGDGTFEQAPPEAQRHTPMFSMGTDVGDINNDGRTDLMTSDMMSRSRLRRQTESAETMMNPNAMPEEGSAPQVMRNNLYINIGGDQFVELAHFAGVAASEWTWTTKLADMDLDGFQDLLITNGFVNDSMNADEYGRLRELQREGKSAELFEAMRTRPRLLTENLAFRNSGDLTFEDVSEEWGFQDSSVANGMSLADFDGDGDLDAIVNTMNSPAAVYQNTATANRLKIALRGDASNSYGIGARLTLDGPWGTQMREMSPSGGYMSSHEPVAVFGMGDATSADKLTIDWPSGHRTELEDVEANQSLVIHEPEGDASIPPPPPVDETLLREVGADLGLAAHEESTFDDFGEQPLLPFALSRMGPGVSWADVDGDDDEDLVVVGGRGSQGMLYRNDGGEFEVEALTEAPEGLEDLAALVWPGDGGGSPSLLTSLSSVESGDEGGHQMARGLSPVGDEAKDVSWAPEGEGSAGAMAAADYDGDGDLDVFLGGRVMPGSYPLPVGSHLFENDDGRLIEVETDALSGLGLATGALWTDADSDGDPDLFVATEWGPVHMFENDGGDLRDATGTAGLGEYTGMWTGMDAGDMDHDGDMDLVAANLGLNTPYHASAEQPMTLMGGDIDDDGDADIIETEWDGSQLYPHRNRLETSNALSGVWERFTTYRDFALATLDDVLGTEGMERATRFEVTTLSHTLFVNDGGSFSAVPLPVEAQLIAAFGVGVVDMDGDGHEDIVLAGNNSYAEPMHVGPLNGAVGIILAGDGAGDFAAVPPTESGFRVPYDSRGLAVSDYDQDGWPDVAVGVNNGRPLVFHNNGSAGRSGLLVRLDGPDSNPHGVGARVELSGGQTTLTREVRAGGSWMSQHGAALTFGTGEDVGPFTITVTWPDGSTSEVEGRPGETVVVSALD